MNNPKAKKIPHKFQPWIRVRKQYKLSHAHVQMARELGLEPRRFGSYADTTDQPWKQPLAQFIESLYLKRFGRERPSEIMSIEDIAAAHVAKRLARKQARSELKSNSSDTDGQALSESIDSKPEAEPR